MFTWMIENKENVKHSSHSRISSSFPIYHFVSLSISQYLQVVHEISILITIFQSKPCASSISLHAVQHITWTSYAKRQIYSAYYSSNVLYWYVGMWILMSCWLYKKIFGVSAGPSIEDLTRCYVIYKNVYKILVSILYNRLWSMKSKEIYNKIK